MKYKILNTVGPSLSPAARKILSTVGKVTNGPPTQAELDKKIQAYDIAVVGLGFTFHLPTLRKAVKLKAIATATTGLDHIDVEFAKKRGIAVLSLRGESKFLDTITGTAELALGLMLDLMRGISLSFELVKKGKWDREKFRGHLCYGKTLGIVGLGRLGKMMAHYGRALGMRVIAFDPYAKKSDFKKTDAAPVSFKKLLKESDVISLHVHLSDKTENMFGKSAFAQIKPTAYIVNTARGKIVNEKDLLVALKQKRIAGYAADVLADELSFRKRIGKNAMVAYAKTHSNIIITPHIGGMTYESRAATDIFMAKKVVQWVKKLKISVKGGSASG